MEATTPRSMAVRASSAHVHSDSERSAFSGSSHASFTRCVAITGGKSRGAAATRLVDQAGEPVRLEATRPLANDLALSTHLPRHRQERPTLRHQQDDLRADHIAMSHPQSRERDSNSARSSGVSSIWIDVLVTRARRSQPQHVGQLSCRPFRPFLGTVARPAAVRVGVGVAVRVGVAVGIRSPVWWVPSSGELYLACSRLRSSAAVAKRCR